MLTTLLLTASLLPAAQATADRAAITQAALDYIEGFYDGSAERMTRALHPDLAKRIVKIDPATGKARLDHMGAEALIGMAKSREARPTPKDKQQKDVTILDVYGNVATVKVVANDWIDYLHIAKFNERWVIVNVLWEMKGTK